MFGKVLDPACYSGTFFEYCASSTAKETCCGICTVVPIAYPGTLIAWTLGSFCNLLYALIFRAEAPYNLLFQFLSVDAALISLIDRYFESTNRIDLWDYCLVPMSICSAIPVAVAIALSRIEDLHVIGPGASLQLRQQSRMAETFSTGDEVNHWVKRELQNQERLHQGMQSARKRSNRMSSLSRQPRRLSEKKREEPSDDDLSPRPDGTIASSHHDHHRLHPEVFPHVPHPKLPEKLIWFLFGHLVVFTIVFAVLFTTIGNTSQSNCNKEFKLERWRMIMGVLTACWLLIGYLACYVLYINVKHYHDPNHRFHGIVSWSGVFSLLQWTGNDETAILRKVSHRKERIIRIVICLFVYALWAGPYLWVWISGVNNFMLLGPNPWPFEQVGAATSIFIPFLVVWRGVVDRQFQLACKKADHDAAEIEKKKAAGPLPNSDGEEPPPQHHGLFHPPISTLDLTDLAPETSARSASIRSASSTRSASSRRGRRNSVTV